jgi:hypothetical protein
MHRFGLAWGAVMALVALTSTTTAFAPTFSHVQLRSASRASVARPLRRTTGVTKLSAMMEGADAFTHLAATLPAMHGAGFADVHQHLSAALPSLHLAGATDMDFSWVSDAQQLLAQAAAAATDVVEATEEKQPGLFEKFVDIVELALTTLHNGLKGAGVPGAWGLSIMLFTLFVKGITYPLNYKQMASTIALQQLQPKVALISAPRPRVSLQTREGSIPHSMSWFSDMHRGTNTGRSQMSATLKPEHTFRMHPPLHSGHGTTHA